MIHIRALATGSAVAASAIALALAAVGDLRAYRIPNLIPAVLAASFALAACFMPRSFLLGGLATGAGLLAVGGLLFALGVMGGGDAKLLAATALWAGPTLLSAFALVTSLAGMALAVVMLSPLRRLMPAPPQRLSAPGGGPREWARQPMPYGVAIAAGGLWVLGRHLAITG